MRRFLVALSVAVALCGCVNVNVNKHIAASDYTRSITRLAVFLPTDDSLGGFSQQFSPTFKAEIQAQLDACHVQVLLYQVDPMQLDGQAKITAALTAFKPDATLLLQHTNRFIYNGDERGEGYLLTLHDMTEKRDVWKGSIGIGASSRLLTDRTHTGATFADKAVRQMADDGVLKACPPPAPLPERT